MKDLNCSIGLVNPKSPSNVGSVIRAVSCFNADAIYYTGVRYDRAMKFNTDTKNNVKSIPVTAVSNLLDPVTKDTSIICVELVEGAIPLPVFKHPKKAFYIFGPEDGTIDQNLINKADEVIYIPTIGCLNLAATVNIILYDRLLKSNNIDYSNALISKSKDVNNRIKIINK
jgi:tRNA(Leu) C34 or U34 (ribose-2'-O)-methylase TrmL